MTKAAAASRSDERPHERLSVVHAWPHGVSREPSMRISDVLATLQPEFPTLTPSKLRFLEEQELVEPQRSQGGYRQYSPADVERVRYILGQQRDHYLPLRVIGDQLAELDRGDRAEPVVPHLATSQGTTRPRSADRHSVESLAQAAGVETGFVETLVDAGVLSPSASGHLDSWALDVVVAASALAEHGVQARHLRAFRAAADRQVDVVDQIVAPLRGQRAGAAHVRAGTVAAEVGELCGRLHTALVRAGTARLAP